MQVHSKETVEERTRHWLEASFLDAVASLGDPEHGIYDAEGQPRRLTRRAFQDVQRKLKIFRWLDRLSFESFIDVGAGFDHYPNLVRERYGVPAYFSDFAHSLILPYGGAEHGRLDRAVTLNITRLPFADDTFDVVLASEVLEHLVSPVEAIAELLRVARKYVIMTSLEALSTTRWQRLLAHLRVDVRQPHVERNFFLLHELEAIFGDDWQHENLFYDADLPASAFTPQHEQDAAYRSLRNVDAFVAALCSAVRVSDHRSGAMGVLLVKAKPNAEIRPSSTTDHRALARWLIERTAAELRAGYGLIEQIRKGTAPFPAADRPIAAEVLALVRCPDCRGVLTRAGSGVRCSACDTTFSGEYGVPILYPARGEGPYADPDWLQRLCNGDPRRERVVRQVAERLRRSERPPGWSRRLFWQLDRLLGDRPHTA